MPASDVLKMLLKVGKNDLSVAERVTAEKLSAEGFEGLQAPMRGLKRDAGVPAKTSDSRWEETKARFEEFAKSRQGAAPETASSGGLRVPTFTRNWLNDRALGPQAFMRTVASDSEAGLVFKATRDAVGRVETNGVMSSVHIGEGLYATAAHGIDTGRTWEQVFQPHKRIFVNGDAAALVAGDKRADAALLYVHKHEKNPFVGVGSTRELEVGQTIHTVGFPAQSPLALVSEDPFRALALLPGGGRNNGIVLRADVNGRYSGFSGAPNFYVSRLTGQVKLAAIHTGQHDLPNTAFGAAVEHLDPLMQAYKKGSFIQSEILSSAQLLSNRELKIDLVKLRELSN